jgi:tetratricopeptide (TPR) repeat protein
LAGSESAFLRLLSGREPVHFASVDPSLRGSKTRHNLAVIYFEQGRHAEAEAQWKVALAEDPQSAHAWLGLGELYLQQRRWPEVQLAIDQLSQPGGSRIDAEELRTRLRSSMAPS